KRVPEDDPNYKVRLSAIGPTIQQYYKSYSDEFTKDNLPALQEQHHTSQERADLLSLYKYSAKAFVDLKIILTTVKKNTVSNDCQNCTVGEVGSFDHYLPKEKFPEYAVNPLNLIPSCSICNGHKGAIWQSEGNRLFLSPYQDILPTDQYLFINVKATRDDVEIEFFLKNSGTIDKTLYERIENHYSKLHLCNRFAGSCAKTIEETQNELKNYLPKLPLDEIKATIIETANDNRRTFGMNHFKYLLPIALVKSHDFVHQYCGIQVA
ncbi:MAG: hypothetical protein ACXVJN_04265, partial [Mucilaginibacter sp.]